MNEIFFLTEEAPEGGYTARAQGLSIFTEAETMDEQKSMPMKLFSAISRKKTLRR